MSVAIAMGVAFGLAVALVDRLFRQFSASIFALDRQRPWYPIFVSTLSVLMQLLGLFGLIAFTSTRQTLTSYAQFAACILSAGCVIFVFERQRIPMPLLAFVLRLLFGLVAGLFTAWN
jgi:hypothetical protein